jgi:3-oxoacyl-[acyl-carrier protein] reductase
MSLPDLCARTSATERQWESCGEAGQRALINGIALKRLRTPHDIANGMVVFCIRRRKLDYGSGDLH